MGSTLLCPWMVSNPRSSPCLASSACHPLPSTKPCPVRRRWRSSTTPGGWSQPRTQSGPVSTCGSSSPGPGTGPSAGRSWTAGCPSTSARTCARRRARRCRVSRASLGTSSRRGATCWSTSRGSRAGQPTRSSRPHPRWGLRSSCWPAWPLTCPRPPSPGSRNGSPPCAWPSCACARRGGSRCCPSWWPWPAAQRPPLPLPYP